MYFREYWVPKVFDNSGKLLWEGGEHESDRSAVNELETTMLNRSGYWDSEWSAAYIHGVIMRVFMLDA